MEYEELTKRIIGCAMRVHSTLGNGFQEVIYQRCLAIELRDEGLNFSREHEMDIFYKGHKVGTRRVDFFVEENIMVEIKAVIQLEDVHLAQAMNYVQAYSLRIGLLINFGSKSLTFKRVHNNRVIYSHQNQENNLTDSLNNQDNLQHESQDYQENPFIK